MYARLYGPASVRALRGMMGTTGGGGEVSIVLSETADEIERLEKLVGIAERALRRIGFNSEDEPKMGTFECATVAGDALRAMREATP